MPQSFEERLREEWIAEYGENMVWDGVSKWWLQKFSEYKQSLKDKIDGEYRDIGMRQADVNYGYNQAIDDILKLID